MHSPRVVPSAVYALASDIFIVVRA